MNKTDIEWCDYTWNPLTGCLHGCEYCYARGIAKRFSNKNLSDKNDLRIKELKPNYQISKIHDMGNCLPFPYDFNPTLYRCRLDEPQNLKKPSNIFVCSMADLFGEWVPDEWIQEVFTACEAAPWHRYLFLTKNPGRYANVVPSNIYRLNTNLWFGATVNNDSQMHYIPQALTSIHANFLSIEPLHSDFNAELVKFGLYKWIIIGAESGNRKSKIIPKREWIENIVEQCRASGVPVFMKNSLAGIWGGELIQEYPW